MDIKQAIEFLQTIEYLEIGDAVLPALLMKRVVDGDKEAIEEARNKLDGLTLYAHGYSVDEKSEVIMKFERLCELGLIDYITIGQDKRATH